MSWAIGGLVAVVLFYIARRVIVGGLVPLNITGRHYLKQVLKQNGIELPQACLQEFADNAVQVEKFSRIPGRPEGKHEYVVKALDLDARAIAMIIRGEQEEEPYRSLQDRPKEILRRHGVIK